MGHSRKAIGNWSPYVAGMNQDSNGNTFVTMATIQSILMIFQETYLTLESELFVTTQMNAMV